MVGSDVCPPDLVEKVGAGPADLLSMWPTEATVVSTSRRALVPGEAVTIGRALRYDARTSWTTELQPVFLPPGVAGELYVARRASPAAPTSGSRGLTASRFVASQAGGQQVPPLAASSGGPAPRGWSSWAGPTTRSRSASASNSAKSSRRCSARRSRRRSWLAKPDPAGQKRLVAYVAGEVTAADLRTFLGQRLPKTPGADARVRRARRAAGQRQRQARPGRAAEPAEETADYVAPRESRSG